MKLKCFFLFLAIGAALLHIGCATTGAVSDQLARIAKDWALTIRASQVIPVYPLTEDLQPGDIFLVRTRIEDQIKIYESKGFLPLENLLVRLQPANYDTFYAYLRRWKFPADTAKTNNPAYAPRAAFPSYSFSVERGVGFNLAVPVQAVPVAMNLLAAGKAYGSITIADAYTYGVDMYSLHHRVKDWAKTCQNYLATFAPADDDTNYLRVVNRVYLTGKVNVWVASDEAAGAKVSGGVPRPVDLLKLISRDTTGQNYEKVMSALNNSVDTSAYGGTLKVAAASGRSISLIERFPRPLAIGYIAFDLPILEKGELGSPLSTQSRFNRTPIIPENRTVFESDDNSVKIKQWLSKTRDENRRRLRKWLDEQGYKDQGITNIINGKGYADLRNKIVLYFQII
jgi:hypothetical protein